MVLASRTVQVQSNIYLCIDEHGTKEYKNTGDTKGCKKVNLPPLALNAPVVPSAGDSSSNKPRPATPPDFPKVDGETQKAHDSDHHQILQNELKLEQQKLTTQEKVYNNGAPERQGNERNYAKYQDRVILMQEELTRTQKDIEALKRGAVELEVIR